MACSIGFDGHYKAGHWTPVEITFLGGSSPYVGQVRLTLPDGDGTPSTVTAPRPVQLLPGKRTRVVMYAKFGDGFGDLRVQLRADDRNVIDERFETNGPPGTTTLPLALQANEKLIVTLGTRSAWKTQCACTKWPAAIKRRWPCYATPTICRPNGMATTGSIGWSYLPASQSCFPGCSTTGRRWQPLSSGSIWAASC